LVGPAAYVSSAKGLPREERRNEKEEGRRKKEEGEGRRKKSEGRGESGMAPPPAPFFRNYEAAGRARFERAGFTRVGAATLLRSSVTSGVENVRMPCSSKSITV
jgi:hypothetical protein